MATDMTNAVILLGPGGKVSDLSFPSGAAVALIAEVDDHEARIVVLETP